MKNEFQDGGDAIIDLSCPLTTGACK